MNNIFNTDEMTTCLDQVGVLTYETEQHGYKTFVTVRGTFWSSGVGVQFRKPRGKKFVYLCRPQNVVDFRPTKKVGA